MPLIRPTTASWGKSTKTWLPCARAPVLLARLDRRVRKQSVLRDRRARKARSEMWESRVQKVLTMTTQALQERRDRMELQENMEHQDQQAVLVRLRLPRLPRLHRLLHRHLRKLNQSLQQQRRRVVVSDLRERDPKAVVERSLPLQRNRGVKGRGLKAPEGRGLKAPEAEAEEAEVVEVVARGPKAEDLKAEGPMVAVVVVVAAAAAVAWSSVVVEVAVAAEVAWSSAENASVSRLTR